MFFRNFDRHQIAPYCINLSTMVGCENKPYIIKLPRPDVTVLDEGTVHSRDPSFQSYHVMRSPVHQLHKRFLKISSIKRFRLVWCCTIPLLHQYYDIHVRCLSCWSGGDLLDVPQRKISVFLHMLMDHGGKLSYCMTHIIFVLLHHVSECYLVCGEHPCGH